MSTLAFISRESSKKGEVGRVVIANHPSLTFIDWQEFESAILTLNISQSLIVDFSESPERILQFATCAQLLRPPKSIIAVVSANIDEALLSLVTNVAQDVIQVPCSDVFLKSRIERLLRSCNDKERAQAHLLAEFGLKQIIGEHPSFRAVLDRVPIISGSDLPVLIFGETGTGKELFARAIHAVSERRDLPFVPVECGAIPDELAESEIFGHERGAYTDARTARLGLVGMAEGGTLFLDEIDSLSLRVQSKLLRFLQEGSYRPLGCDHYKQANVRIIAATNRSLLKALDEKQFRSDLFFRLSVLRLDIPPLRERPSDICLLVNHFLRITCHEGDGRFRFFSPDALQKLLRYEWPGNVRELSNVINRAVLFSTEPEIPATDIIFDGNSSTADDPQGRASSDTFRKAKAQAVGSFEKQYLGSLLEAHSGNITRAAMAAGKDRAAFRRLLKKHGITWRQVG